MVPRSDKPHQFARLYREETPLPGKSHGARPRDITQVIGVPENEVQAIRRPAGPDGRRRHSRGRQRLPFVGSPITL